MRARVRVRVGLQVRVTSGGEGEGEGDLVLNDHTAGCTPAAVHSPFA